MIDLFISNIVRRIEGTRKYFLNEDGGPTARLTKYERSRLLEEFRAQLLDPEGATKSVPKAGAGRPRHRCNPRNKDSGVKRPKRLGKVSSELEK